jgi:tRNA A37 threonylcarbamoyladenosine synthetase subunit TsaC/SUA5/YrdC
MLDMVGDVIASRAANHHGQLSAADQQRLRDHVRQRVDDILDDWAKVAGRLQTLAVASVIKKTRA